MEIGNRAPRNGNDGGHRTTVAIAVALAIGLTATWLSPAFSKTTGLRAPLQLAVFQLDSGYLKRIDEGNPGTSAGDLFLERHPLVDRSTGQVAGHSISKVTVVRSLPQGDFLGIIDSTVELQGGSLYFYGGGEASTTRTAAGADFPVIGGTGAYAGAQGTVNLRVGTLGGKSGAFLSFDITTP